jgi:hypothetical protein
MRTTLPADQNIRLLDEAGIGRVLLVSTLNHPENAADLPGMQRELAALDDVLTGVVVRQLPAGPPPISSG